MTFAQLRVLQAVARTGSVTRAAEELGISQPAVSHALRNLERELGVTLLIRHSTGVTPTTLGHVVSRRAADILTQLEGLNQEVSAARGQAAGRLRVGVIPSVNARLMPSVLRAFQAAHDRTQMVVVEGSDAEVIEWVQTGAVDVATVTSSAPDLTTTVLASDQMVAVLPATHPLAARSAVELRDLAQTPFIMSTGGCEPLITDLAQRAGIRLRSHYRIRDTNSIVAMVAEHLGVTIMPEFALPADVAGICTIPLKPVEHRQILLALPADAAPLPLATAFVDIAGRAVDAQSDVDNGSAARQYNTRSPSVRRGS